jgi:hypothetical protein
MIDAQRGRNDMVHLDPRIAAVRSYLGRAFDDAFISSRPGQTPDSREFHTFRVETSKSTHLVSVCSELIQSYRGDMYEYLEHHRVADVLRLMGSGRIVLTSTGPRTQCAEAARAQAARRGPGGKTAPLTTEERRRFLESLAEHGNVAFAADSGGKSRACFYHHRKHDPEFARAWAAARASVRGRVNRSTIRERARRQARERNLPVATRRAS